MSQCVPSWDVSMLGYEVAELTWENGQPSMHGLGPPRVPAKPIFSGSGAAVRSTVNSAPSKYTTWDKPRASGTLESIVNQATSLPHRSKSVSYGGAGDDMVPWFDPHRAAAASNTMTMDAMVPCSNDQQQGTVARGVGACLARVGSCSGPHVTEEVEEEVMVADRRAGVARVPVVSHDWSSMDQSVSGSATFGRDSQHVTFDTCDRELAVGFTSTSMGSPENTKTTTVDDHDSVSHSRPQRERGDDEEDKKKGTGKSSVSTKRSRAAAIHNQSERKRRDKINQRMKTLQKLVPNSSKTDKASMLDEVIEYLKQLQAQVHMMSRMNMSSMMLPMTMQQQLQMSMMTPMGMGMGLGMGLGMDMNSIGRANITGIPPVLHPSAFMPMAAAWDTSAWADRLQGPPAAVMPDPMSAFLACQSQPITMDAYSRMAAMYQQLHQPQAPSSKS